MNPIHQFKYSLHLADNALILAQRNSEWTGHGPVLEQDIAITNIALDLLGQARNFYQHAAVLYSGFDPESKMAVDQLIPHLWKSYGREINEDDLAYLRDERQFLNIQLVELPRGDWAYSLLRQFFFSAFQILQYRQIMDLHEEQLSGIAEKALKELQYHLRWSSEWIIRMGDGTEESATRLKKALDAIWPFTGEMFLKADYEFADPADCREGWLETVQSIFQQARLELPKQGWMQQGGKSGMHTEHMGYLLAEMQYMQRTWPNAVW